MDKIVERIRKLLALAGNNPSDAEREAALSKAHALLVEHNLQMHDVADVVETVAAHDMLVRYPSTWSRVISGAVAGLYFCKFVYTPHRQNRTYTAHFVGMRTDAEIAQMVANSIIGSVARQAEIHARATGGSVASFKNGAAATVWHRCQKLRAEAEQKQAVPGKALVVQSLYKTRLDEATKWAQNRWPGLGKGKSRGRALDVRYDQAGQAGAAFGQSVSLTAQVGKR
jgi:hypothetical protein